MEKDSKKSWLSEAFGEVRPLAGRDQRVTPAPKSPRPKGRAGATRGPTAMPQRQEDWCEVEGGALRSGVDRRRLLRELRRDAARMPRLDLHGLTRAEAEGRLERSLAQRQQRWLAVIHGKGLHSASPPVLAEAVERVVREGACAGAVLAFLRLPSLPGGSGVTYLYLKL